MRVTFLGTGGSLVSAERGYPAILINDDLLLDCGEGTTQKLIKLDAVEHIQTICITHLHCDHFTGLFTLLWHDWILKRKESLTIVGPEGVENAVESILTLVHTPPYMRTFDIHYHELKDGDDIQHVANGYDITCLKTDHEPLTFAYRIEEDGVSACYTGDTGPERDLVRLTGGCHLLMHEASFPGRMRELAHGVHHSTPKDAATLARRSHSEVLALLHVSSTLLGDLSALKSEAEEVFKKRVIIAKDLMSLEF